MYKSKKVAATQARLLSAAFALICIFISDATNGATASIDFLSDDISFQAYDALNLLLSAEDLSDPVWQLVNTSGRASKSGQSLILESNPGYIFQTVDLIAGETYILAFTGVGTNSDIVWLNVRESASRSNVAQAIFVVAR